VEGTLEKVVRQEVKQHVILRARMEKLEVFGADHPATQEHKLSRLAELGRTHPAKLHFIPIDFTKESLTTLTHSSPYDPKVKSLFN
jgi:O-methyltransferase involved in polyketide biosynthesis